MFMLEFVHVLRDAAKVGTAAGFELPPIPKVQILDAYDLIKLVFDDKKDSFVTINRIRDSHNRAREPDWTTFESTGEWTKIELSANRKSEVELSIVEAGDQTNFVNRKVVVSETPEVTQKSKFHVLQTGKPLTFKTKAAELYVKFLKDETFFSFLDG